MRFCLPATVCLTFVLTASVFAQPASEDGVVNVRSGRYGAKADGKTNDTDALKAAIADARRLHAPLYLPAGTYRISATLDITGLDVTGGGRSNTILRLDASVQQDAVVSRGDTSLRHLQIFGGWDGHTPGLAGAGFATLSDPDAKPPFFGYDVRLDNVSIQYAKQDSIRIDQGGYESLHNVKCNAAGRNGLELESGHHRGFATTTVNIDGLSTFSDTGQYAVSIQDGQTVSFSGRTTMENTMGIRLSGIDGRTLKISGVHQENTRGGRFLTAADSSGIGLTLTDNFFAGSPVLPEPPGELDHWFNITLDTNTLGNTAGTGGPVAIRSLNVRDAEPVELLQGGWHFSDASPTVLSVVTHHQPSAWSARLAGHWVTGGETPKAAHEFLLTSMHPLVQIGPTTLRFSLDASGRLQGKVEAKAGNGGPFEFQGVVELVVDRHHTADGDLGLDTAAGVHVGRTRIDSLAGKGVIPVCTTEDGTLVRCK